MSDFTDSTKVAERLKSATSRLHKLALETGQARQVRDYSSDQRKNLLAKYMVGPLKEGQSAAAAETIARANEGYLREFETLQINYEAAEQTISKWQAEICSYEAARSLLAMSRETMRQLEG